MQMRKIRLRLAIVFISLIGVSVLICGILSAKLLRDSLMESMRESMNDQLKVIARFTTENTNNFKILSGSEKVSRFTRTVQSQKTQLTWVDRNGRVFGDPKASEVVKKQPKGGQYIIHEYSEIGGRAMYVANPILVSGEMLGYFVLSKSVGQVDASTQRLWNALILGLIIIFSITLIIIIRFAQGITLPIEKITRIVEEITSFNFSSRAIEHDQDEIGKLGQAINTMSQSLDQQLQRIFDDENRFKTVLDNMITGIIMLDADYRISLLNKQAEKMIDYDKKYLLGQSYTVVKHPLELPILIDQCLQTKTGIREELTIYYPYERIVELNIVPLKMLNNEICGMMIMIHDISIIRKLEMMRREFVANVSHEIKTPLTALKGFAETLLAGAIDERETARSFLQIIYNEANRLNRLITDILQLSKMESGQYKLQFSAIELKPFFEKVELMMVTQAKQKSILLRLNVPDGLFIEADEDLLMQIMINLVTNAINYTPHGGRVVIRAQYADSNLDRILFEVSDTGIGIPKQDQERIFERFYRVDKARSRESGGTGLGLSIVKHLVELHQGIITVESQTDTGSTFKIIFPLIQ